MGGCGGFMEGRHSGPAGLHSQGKILTVAQRHLGRSSKAKHAVVI